MESGEGLVQPAKSLKLSRVQHLDSPSVAMPCTTGSSRLQGKVWNGLLAQELKVIIMQPIMPVW